MSASDPARRGRLAWLLPLALLACAPGHSYVVVTVEATGIDGIDRVEVSMANAGATVTRSVPVTSPQATPFDFSIEFTAERRGALDVEVRAFAGESLLGSGRATGTIEPSRVTRMTVRLTAEAMPDLAEADLSPPADLLVADMAQGDLPVPDLARPDATTPDGAARDLASPDMTARDMATAVDKGASDDLAGSDLAVPPDLALPGFTVDLAGLNVIHVSTTGADSNPGTAAQPMATIQAGVVAAVAPAVVVIARGDYFITQSINVTKDVSLLGGFDADFARRTFSGTVITSSNQEVVSVNSPAPPSVVIEGLTLRGNSSSQNRSTVVAINNACPTVRYNTIFANGTSMGSESKGISLHLSGGACEALFQGNFIHGGIARNSRGIDYDAGNPRIYNNTIHAGEGTNDANAVQVRGMGTGRIVNNILLSRTTSYSFCLEEAGGGNPAELRNNLFVGQYLYRDSSGTVQMVIAGVNDSANTTQLAGTVSANVDAASISAIGFVDGAKPDWHLTAATPAYISTGGRDVLADVPLDRDGDPRTLPLSIGADER